MTRSKKQGLCAFAELPCHPRRSVLARVLCFVIALAFGLQHAMATPAVATHVSAQIPQQQDPKDDPPKKEKKDKEKNGEEGTLEEFEAEATKPDTLRSANSPESEESPGEFWWVVGEFTLYLFVGGAVGSWYRATGTPKDDDLAEAYGVRQSGETTVPLVALNVNYQSIESDVEAYDARLEAGSGPLAVLYRITRYEETNPADELDLSWLYGVLRLSYTRYFEVGLGFGGIFLDGDTSESGGSFTLPIRIEPSRYFGFDYRPTWGWINGNTISDYDLGVRVGVRYVSIRVGYRWTKAGRATLKGPIFGVLLSW